MNPQVAPKKGRGRSFGYSHSQQNSTTSTLITPKKKTKRGTSNAKNAHDVSERIGLIQLSFLTPKDHQDFINLLLANQVPFEEWTYVFNVYFYKFSNKITRKTLEGFLGKSENPIREVEDDSIFNYVLTETNTVMLDGRGKQHQTLEALLTAHSEVTNKFGKSEEESKEQGTRFQKVQDDKKKERGQVRKEDVASLGINPNQDIGDH